MAVRRAERGNTCGHAGTMWDREQSVQHKIKRRMHTPSSLLSAVLVLLSFVPQTTFYPFALSDLGLIGANKRRWQTKAVLLDFDSCSILKR